SMDSSSTDPVTGVVDCNVQCVVPSIEALDPYLPRQLREYFKSAGFRQPVGVAYSYPPSVEAFAPRKSVTLDDVRRDVLDQGDRAIFQCCFGVDSVDQPFVASELASAVNRWLQAEWLDQDPRLLASAVVVPHFPELAAAEIERWSGDDRFVQILLSA